MTFMNCLRWAAKKSKKNGGTETGSIFYGTAEEVNRDNYFDKTEKERRASIKKRRKIMNDDSDDDESKKIIDEVLPAERIEELKKIARRISRSLSKRTDKQSETAGKNTKSSEKSISCNNLADLKLSKTDANGRKVKKKSKKHLFDKQYEVPFLHKQTGYTEPSNDASEESMSREQDDYVLGMLLKNSRVHSAFCHDQISTESTPDEQLIEHEADSVAKRAADSIRRSRRRFNSVEPQQKKLRFGEKTAGGFVNLNSSKDKEMDSERKLIFGGDALLKPSIGDESLLTAIRKRKERLLDDETNKDVVEEREYPSLLASGIEPMKSRFDDLADDIRTFLVVRDGKATTFEILDNFKDKIPVQDTTVFRSILRRLCTFYVETRTWKLKDEFL